MENVDFSRPSSKGCRTTLKRASVITSAPSIPTNSSSISAIVTLHQSRSDSLSATRIHQTNRNQLIGILTESNTNKNIDSTVTTATRKKTVCIEPKFDRTVGGHNIVQVQLKREASASISAGASVSSTGGKSSLVGNNPAPGKQKIPRPANAFMLFANEWRKKLAVENPRDSNKDISVRLGFLWKNMAKEIKENYFALAREVDAEHKRKYPDYVYNPKEARLRKAMREQNRELSRQSILQTAITSTAGNPSSGGPSCGSGGGGNGPQTGIGSTNFLNHQMNCPPSAVASAISVGAAVVSSLPGSPSFNSGNRIINPWFPAGHPQPANHLKQTIHSPRVMTVAQHHQQQQQRTFDKTKEVLRKQAECAAGTGFSTASTAGYATEFSSHGTPPSVPGQGHSSSAHETNDYCVIAEFSEGQKWHPYQNGPTPYHSRGGGPLTKMGAMHSGMQPTNPHAHGGWNQFCAVPLSNPAMNRASRHMVFLQEQQQSQHCGFPDEMQIPYMQSKHVEITHRLHPGYSQQDHQTKHQSTSMSPINMSQLQEPEKCIEDGPRWESGTGETAAREGPIGAVVAGHPRHDSELQLRQEQHEQEQEQSRPESRDSRAQQQQHRDRDRDKQQQQQHYNESPSAAEVMHKKVANSKQPLPGFHQAFGSTEIGRFSRSEFFANMVGESSNVSSNNRNSCNASNDRCDVTDNATDDLGDTSINVENNVVRQSVGSAHHQNRGDATVQMENCNSQVNSSNDATNDVSPNDPSFNNNLPPVGVGVYYNDVRSPGPSGTDGIAVGTTIPRWHSPYMSAIGSEI